MYIENCHGAFESHSWDLIRESILLSASNPLDDIWLNGDHDYPCLAILVNGNKTCIHYFLDSNGNMLQSIGYGNTDVAFGTNGEKTIMPANAVISLDKAIECAKQFFDTGERPNCIEWRFL